MNTDNLNPKGYVRISVIDNNGNVIETQSFTNQIVTSGKNLMRDFLKGNILSGIKYLAVGTGNKAVADSDIMLGNEVYRETPSDVTVEDGILHLYFFIPSTEISGTFYELGLFANNATSTLNSGTLFSRTIPSSPITKTSVQALTVQWDITL